MGVFGDWAERYWDLGINVYPIGENKLPLDSGWAKYQTERQSESDLSYLIQKYNHASGIAWFAGPGTGMSYFDFDYKEDKRLTITKEEYEKDRKKVEAYIKSVLPLSSLEKVGQTGWTRFYKYNPEHQTKAPNRNGVRLFDFKSNGYTVVPPSLHSINSGKALFYKWTIGNPEDDFSDIPEIDFSLILELEATLRSGNTPLQDLKSTRHGRLFLYGCSMASVASDPKELGELIIKKDIEIHKNDSKGLYFESDHVSNNKEKFATSWAERIIKSSLSKITNKSSQPLNEGYDYFFEEKTPYGKPIKDILTKKVFYQHPSENRLAQGDEIIDGIISHGLNAGLKNPDTVKREFARYEIEKKDLDFLIDIPDWDGVDHLRQMTDCLQSSYFNNEEIYQIVLYWGHGIFRRIFENDYQNQCLILQGGQGIGKDSWVKCLVGDFGPYYQGIQVQEIGEMISAVHRVYVAHLEEFDQTRKMDVPELKAIITQPNSFYREKYGRVATKKSMKASWISTVNVDDFFRDSTGNRRFIVIPLDMIIWDYPKDKSRMILGQFKATKPHVMNDQLLGKIKTLVASMTPDDTSVYVEELVREYLRMSFKLTHSERISYSEMATKWLEIARLCGISVFRVQRTAKKYARHSNGIWYYRNKLPS